jgi:HNH endonuclease
MSDVRNPTVRDAALKRDTWCMRCCSKRSLEVHHIVAIADGGADELDNVEVLCYPCHKEWHQEAEGHVSYDVFLDDIPARILARFARIPELASLPISELRELWRVATLGIGAAHFGVKLAFDPDGSVKTVRKPA